MYWAFLALDLVHLTHSTSTNGLGTNEAILEAQQQRCAVLCCAVLCCAVLSAAHFKHLIHRQGNRV